MLEKWLFAPVWLGLSTYAALACGTHKEMELRDIFSADIVVLGDVRGYEIVGARGAYARFDVRVRQVFFPDGAESAVPTAWSTSDMEAIVAGKEMLSVSWVNSTFGLPESLSSEDRPGFLIALRKSADKGTSRLGGSDFIEGPESEDFVVLQAHCSSAFIFKARDPVSIALQQVMETSRDRESELEILEEFLFERSGLSKLESEIFMLKNGLSLAMPPASGESE